MAKSKNKQTREEYLAGSLSQLKPWAAEGISRRTYYRRLKQPDGTSPLSTGPRGTSSGTSSGTSGGTSPPDGTGPRGTSPPRRGRRGDEQLARRLLNELRAMGKSSSEPNALDTAFNRIKRTLSDSDQKRSPGAIRKVLDRWAPRLDTRKWTAHLQQKLNAPPDEASKLIDYLVAVAEPSGGNDYIDKLISSALKPAGVNASKHDRLGWLWWCGREMERQPGWRAQARPEMAGSANRDAVLTALDHTPRSIDELAKTTGLTREQIYKNLAWLRHDGLAFRHGHALWARIRPQTAPLTIADKIWIALEDDREAFPHELAGELGLKLPGIKAELSRLKKGIKEKKVVKTAEGKYTRSTPGAINCAPELARALIQRVLADGRSRGLSQLAVITGKSKPAVHSALHRRGGLLQQGTVRRVSRDRYAPYILASARRPK